MKEYAKNCNKIEDESHFLIDCVHYKCDRIEEFKNITSAFSSFEEIADSKTKFIFFDDPPTHTTTYTNSHTNTHVNTHTHTHTHQHTHQYTNLHIHQHTPTHTATHSNTH